MPSIRRRGHGRRRKPHRGVVPGAAVSELDPEAVGALRFPDKKLRVCSVKLGSGAGHWTAGTAGHCTTTGGGALGAVAQAVAKAGNKSSESAFFIGGFLGGGGDGSGVVALALAVAGLGQAGDFGALGFGLGRLGLERGQRGAGGVALVAGGAVGGHGAGESGGPDPAGHDAGQRGQGAEQAGDHAAPPSVNAATMALATCHLRA